MFTPSREVYRFEQPNLDPNLIQRAPDISGSLDQLFNAYLAMKQQDRQRQQDATQRGASLLQYGFDPSKVTPGAITQTTAAMDRQGPGLPAEAEPVPGLRAYLEKRRSGEALKTRESAADLAFKESSTQENLAQAEKLRREAGGAGSMPALKPNERASIEGQIMDDYMKSPTFSNFAAAKSSLRDLASIQANKSGAGDIAAIYSFIKTMDPNAVKEGEVAMTQSALPGLDRVKIIYDSMKSGNKITAEMKRELLTVARGMYDAKLKSADEFRNPFVRRAQQYGINPDIAAPGFAIPQNELDAMLGQPQGAAVGISLTGTKAARLAELRARAGR